MERREAAQLVYDAIQEHLDIGRVEYDDTTLIKDLDADSLDLVELSLIVEDKLTEDIHTRDLKGLHTVGDLINVVSHYTLKV